MSGDVEKLDRAAFFARLRNLTPARIGLGQAGVSIATADHLAFQQAHAQARDAVHAKLDVTALVGDLGALSREAITVSSAAPDRAIYLARPDLGRRLNEASRARLREVHLHSDIALVIADGLSALAVQTHAVPLLDQLLPHLSSHGASLAPIVIVEQGRVAIGDEIGAVLGAQIVCVMIGERPGLSSPDSLGIYLTFAPRIGRTDAERNCLSNIRPAGMSYTEAAHRCAWLIAEALRRQLTGVMLKDESQSGARIGSAQGGMT